MPTLCQKIFHYILIFTYFTLAFPEKYLHRWFWFYLNMNPNNFKVLWKILSFQSQSLHLKIFSQEEKTNKFPHLCIGKLYIFLNPIIFAFILNNLPKISGPRLKVMFVTLSFLGTKYFPILVSVITRVFFLCGLFPLSASQPQNYQIAHLHA